MTYYEVDFYDGLLPRNLPPTLDEKTARENVETLRRIGKRHGITNLRFASKGRLVACVEEDRDMFDIVRFTREVIEELDRYTEVFDERMLSKPGISPDLPLARAL